FQAEDGIRDKLVTGVQTCALPIFLRRRVRHTGENRALTRVFRVGPHVERDNAQVVGALTGQMINQRQTLVLYLAQTGRRAVAEQIGRASCRERVESTVVT